MISWILLLVLLHGDSASRYGHPVYVSSAEVEYKEKTGKLEVAMKVDANDLEQILRRRSKMKVDLETTAKVDDLILDYLQEVFVVTDSKKTKQKLTWVGKEVTEKETWLYFEVDAPNGIDGAKFTHTFLLDLVEEQVNTIHFKIGKQRQSMNFTKDKKTQTLTLDSKTSERQENPEEKPKKK